jgi:hypothetical protein
LEKNEKMNTQQIKRYEKVFSEPLYQLDFKQDSNKNIFVISGSTKNVYEVVLKDHKFECNCPDGKIWSKRHHVVCKHVCYVLFRVTKIFLLQDQNVYFSSNLQTPTLFFETHKLDDKEQKFIEAFLSKKQFSSDILNEKLKQKYLEALIPKESLFSQSTKTIEEEDECPICYDTLLTKDVKLENLLSCPTCKNYVHPKCMEKWLEYNQSCVYCRSEIWSKLNEKSSRPNKSYVNLK